MKYAFLIIGLFVPLLGPGADDGLRISIKESGPWAKASDTLPDYSRATSSRLTPVGIGHLFDECLGTPRPEGTRWIAGGYRILSVEGIPSGAITGFIQIDKAQVPHFAEAVVAEWRKRFVGAPGVRIGRIETKYDA